MNESRPLTALVVDDDATGRAFLRALLKRAGYTVEIAASGEEALQRFTPGTYDAVFMDIRMPGIDGIEATRRIKAMAGDVFTPVIFVTGAGDEASLVRAIDAGGDDFLTKPVTAEVLLAKLRAMERIRALHANTRALYARLLHDQEMAKEVFDRAVLGDMTATPGLRSRMVPAEVFSGDLLLSALSPSRTLHVLVGDFTGHGLTAALGAMPAAEAFRSMVALDFTPAAILEGLNRRLSDALPTGHFLAAALVSVPAGADRFSVANCGLPPLLLRGAGAIRERIASDSFALGILREATFHDAMRDIAVAPGDTLVIASDGASEALNESGEAFGEPRLEALLLHGDADAGIPDRIAAALDAFRGATPFADDVSIVEIRFDDVGGLPDSPPQLVLQALAA